MTNDASIESELSVIESSLLTRNFEPDMDTHPLDEAHEDEPEMLCYKTIILEIMPSFPTIPPHHHSTIETAVKSFLLAVLEEEEQDAEAALAPFVIRGDVGLSIGIPNDVKGMFQGWIYEQLQTIFPEAEFFAPDVEGEEEEEG
ncbi:hypothetical protein HDU98_007967, partial [Podochytrium sp. JEL0797]